MKGKRRGTALGVALMCLAIWGLFALRGVLFGESPGDSMLYSFIGVVVIGLVATGLWAISMIRTRRSPPAPSPEGADE